MKIITCLTIFLFLSVSVFSAQMQDATTEYPAIVVPNTQTIDLTSTNTERDYRISVALPSSYDTSEQAYPVLYVLDPAMSFLTTTETVRFMAAAGVLPEVIVVGIGYPGDTQRSRDYHVFKDKFIGFIEHELFPLIDSTYRTDSTDRAIIGFSYGGEFVIYTLMERSELFNRYVSIDGSDHAPLLPLFTEGVDEFRSIFLGRDVRLFISTSGTESYSSVIQANNVEGLTVTGLSLGSVDHVQTLPLSLAAGIIAIYAD